MTAIHSLKRTLVFGTGSFVGELLNAISQHPHCEYQVAGIVSTAPLDDESYYGYPLLGALEDLHQIVCQQQPEVIIVALPHGSTELFDQELLEARVCEHICIEHAEAVYERLTGKFPMEIFEPEVLIYHDDFQPGRIALLSTRLLSLCVALVGIILFIPLFLLIAILIKLDSPGPVMFVQERSGLNGKCFKLFKFRTMKPADEAISEWEEDNIHRITRVGKWLRKFRLDELPQFFNILRGDMNIVGPRPHPTSNVELFVLVSRNASESGIQVPYYSLRSRVRPGITGWAQVRYRYANNLQEEMEKLRFDLYYVKHYSLWLDIRILFETVATVSRGAGAANNQHGTIDSTDTMPSQVEKKVPESPRRSA